MANTTFTDNSTPIVASWLNPVNTSVYSAIGTGTTAPSTPAEVVANLGVLTTAVATATYAPLTSAPLVTPNLGTPSAGVLTNCTGTAAGLSIGGSAGSLSSYTGTDTRYIALTGAQSIGGIKTFLDGIEITATKAIDFLGTSGLLKVGGTTVVTLRTDGIAIPAATASGDAVRKDQVYQLGTKSMVRLNTSNGYGSTNTKIRRFLNTVTNIGADIAYADSATLGASFTINTDGVYDIMFGDNYASTDAFGISLNTTQPTTGIGSITIADKLTQSLSTGSTLGTCSTAVYLPAGSVIRAHTNGTAAASAAGCLFTITRVS